MISKAVPECRTEAEVTQVSLAMDELTLWNFVPDREPDPLENLRRLRESMKADIKWTESDREFLRRCNVRAD